MSVTEVATKACAVNPLKTSPALGGALAFLGVEGCLPLLHGSQGCTAFALVLLVRHFREAIPLQTTAMSELSTILGGADNIEQAIGNIYDRAKPRLIGLCSTALTETRDEDVRGDLRSLMARHPDWNDLSVVYAPTPDFAGSLEVGWASAVQAMIAAFVDKGRRPSALRQVNLLPASYMTPADVEAVREVVESFGLSVITFPDLSGSLDGHVVDEYVPTTLGGTPVDHVARMAQSQMTLAIGEHMRGAAEALQRRAGVPFRLFDRLTGLEAFDTFVETLIDISGQQPPEKLRRERSRLVDAMLDGHFFFTGRTACVAAEPDLLIAMTRFLDDMGCRIATAVTTMKPSPDARVPCDRLVVGDLDDLERLAPPAGCDLVVANAHADAAANAIGAPLYRIGFPVFDRLGAAHQVTVGYRGTRELLFDIGNIFIGRQAEAEPYRRQNREDADDASAVNAQVAVGQHGS
ncbi:MAG: nitrogenase iron-molybdenum cofactor biosynthesis protein NifN [Rhodospirillales bacterium]|nr:nitrogenase iron-molybdenum cofactor biosynthesis protein NifN [Rhodospirillales bacterium]